MHDADRKKLEELQDVKQQYEERLMEITTVTESLQEENASLRADAQMWKERADAYLSENKALQSAAEDLRLQNGDLRAKVQHVYTSLAFPPAACTPCLQPVQAVWSQLCTVTQPLDQPLDRLLYLSHLIHSYQRQP